MTPQARTVALEGAHNFRDLGGYLTTDGQRVRRCLVFRSAELSRLTDADQAVLDALGIRTVCDFRTRRQREIHPTRWSQAAAPTFWAREYDQSAAEIMAMTREPGVTAQDTRQAMAGVYRALPYEQAASFREVFLRLAAGEVPLLFHCTAGKDRTGVGAAVLLEALGVPRATIVEDYVETDATIDRLLARTLKAYAARQMGDLDEALIRPILRADPLYLEAAYAEIEARNGSVAAYLKDVVGVDDATVAAVRARLLEPA